MKHVTIGVTGHADHGKSCLVQALTGVETDRLPEEKEQGMSIVLGFAPLELREGMIDLIDVPGHERLVKTMIAGATGMDAAILAIAADEAIKPQTIEHLDLLNLIGVRRGVVAITKVDLVEEEDRVDLSEWVAEFCMGTFLEGAPIVFTSSVTQEGISVLRDTLRDIVAHAGPAPQRSTFYLPVDRIFTRPEHGVIVTGTLRGGSVKVGQNVQIMPAGLRAKVYGLEVHGQSVTTSPSGWRTAINLTGVTREDLNRGDALTPPGYLTPSLLLDVKLQLSSRAPEPLKNGLPVRVHFGSTEAMARVSCLSSETIQPGETGFVQLRFQTEVAVPYRERVIVRTVSPVATLGGGIVIDPLPLRHRHGRYEITTQLEALCVGDDADILRCKLLEAQYAGLDLVRLADTFQLDFDTLNTHVDDRSIVRLSENLVLHRQFFDELGVRMRDILTRFHKEWPEKTGISKAALREALPPAMIDKAFCPILDSHVQRGVMAVDAGLVRLVRSGFAADLSPVEQTIAEEIERTFQESRFMTPSIDMVIGEDGRHRRLFQYLVSQKILVVFTDQMHRKTVVFHRDVLSEAVSLLPRHLGNESFSVSQVTDLLKTTRKYSIPILEYLDEIGVTHRIGDRRECITDLVCPSDEHLC